MWAASTRIPGSILWCVLVAAGLLACGSRDGEGGRVLPAHRSGETHPGTRVPIAGIIRIAPNGCVSLQIGDTDWLVIWPTGSTLSDAVNLPGGATLHDGDQVQGTGALTPADPFTADASGYWAYAIGYCAPGVHHVLVLDAVQPPAS
jgi:hypothetical protein